MATKSDANHEEDELVFRDLKKLKWDPKSYTSLDLFNLADWVPFLVCQSPNSQDQQEAGYRPGRRLLRVGKMVSQHRVTAIELVSGRRISLPLGGADSLQVEIRHRRKWYDLAHHRPLEYIVSKYDLPVLVDLKPKRTSNKKASGQHRPDVTSPGSLTLLSTSQHKFLVVNYIERGSISGVISHIDVSNDKSLYWMAENGAILKKLMDMYNRACSAINFTAPAGIIDACSPSDFLETSQVPASAEPINTQRLEDVDQSPRDVDSTKVTLTDEASDDALNSPLNETQDESDSSTSVQVEQELNGRRETRANSSTATIQSFDGHYQLTTRSRESRDQSQDRSGSPRKDIMRWSVRDSTADNDDDDDEDFTVVTKAPRDYNDNTVVKRSRDVSKELQPNSEQRSANRSSLVSSGNRKMVHKAEVEQVVELRRQAVFPRAEASIQSYTQDAADRQDFSSSPEKRTSRSLLLDGNWRQSAFDPSVTWDNHRRPIYRSVVAQVPPYRHEPVEITSSSFQQKDHASTPKPFKTRGVYSQYEPHSEITEPRYEVGIIENTRNPQVTRLQVTNESSKHGPIAVHVVNEPPSDTSGQAQVFVATPVRRRPASILSGRSSRLMASVIEEDRDNGIAKSRVALTSRQAMTSPPVMASTPVYYVQDRPSLVTSRRSTVQGYQMVRKTPSKPKITLTKIESIPARSARVAAGRHRGEDRVTFANDIVAQTNNGRKTTFDHRNQELSTFTEVGSRRQRVDSDSDVVKASPHNSTWIHSTGTLPTKLRGGHVDASFSRAIVTKPTNNNRSTAPVLNSPPQSRPGPRPVHTPNVQTVVTTTTSSVRNGSRRPVIYVTPSSAMSPPAMNNSTGRDARSREISPSWTHRKRR